MEKITLITKKGFTMKREFMSFIVAVLAILLSTNCVFAQTPVNTDKYITLTVSQGDTISLGIQASTDDTPVKIESGSWDTIITAGTNTIYNDYKSQSITMTIYGDVKKFYCSNNGSKITALDASHNTALTYLNCKKNQLTSLNVNGLTNLEKLYCYENQLTSLNVNACTRLNYLDCDDNQLTSLDVSGLTNLEILYCFKNQLTSLNVNACTRLNHLDCESNQLTSLNVSTLTNLEILYCYNNQLTSLDVSTLTNLEYLYCYENRLTSLDISGCGNLDYIVCYENHLSTQAIDNLYCQLPDRTSQETAGDIIVSLSALDTIVLATNKTNATNKDWAVLWCDTADYTIEEVVTNGTYVCGEESVSLADIESEQITIYPNPAKDKVMLKGIKGTRVTVFDANGRIVKQEVINERLDIKDLESGVYYLQVNDITNKIIKE